MNQNIRIGDWKIDTVTAKKYKNILVNAVERKTILTLIVWVLREKADMTARAITKMLEPYIHWVKIITVDNGREFVFHQQVSRALKTKLNFAHPNRASELILNENNIGIIRQYFPKNISLDSVE